MHNKVLVLHNPCEFDEAIGECLIEVLCSPPAPSRCALPEHVIAELVGFRAHVHQG